MTGQCKLCQQLVIPKAAATIDPTGMLQLRALADAAWNHYNLYHPQDLKAMAGALRVFETRPLLTLVNCADPTFTEKTSRLSGVIAAFCENSDKELKSAGVITLAPVPDGPPPGLQPMDESVIKLS